MTQAGIGVPVDPGIEHRVFLIGRGRGGQDASRRSRTSAGASPSGASPGATWSWPWAAAWSPTPPGFAAAVYHRGVPVVHVPTTLLGQVDAAIGGKTGVNLPEGKNLVGAFWQPAAVLCDTEVLATLPPREYRSGLGEMAKYHFLGGDDLRRPAPRRAGGRVRAVKADVRGADEREGGRRASLNYGHTLAHALETAGPLRPAPRRGGGHRPRVRRRAGPPPRADRRRTGRRAPASGGGYDLPDRPARRRRRRPSWSSLMGRDKKAIDGLTFVLDGPRGLEVVEGVDAGVVADVLDEEMRPLSVDQ